MSGDEDGRFEVVLAEALRAVTEQQTRLDNLRSRATVLLSSAALVSSFLGAPTLKEGARIGPVGWLALSALGLVLLTTAAITVPVWKWEFRTRASVLLGAVGIGHDLDSLRRSLSLELERFVDSNEQRLLVMQWLFVLGLASLFMELALWLALLFKG